MSSWRWGAGDATGSTSHSLASCRCRAVPPPTLPCCLSSCTLASTATTTTTTTLAASLACRCRRCCLLPAACCRSNLCADWRRAACTWRKGMRHYGTARHGAARYGTAQAQHGRAAREFETKSLVVRKRCVHPGVCSTEPRYCVASDTRWHRYCHYHRCLTTPPRFCHRHRCLSPLSLSIANDAVFHNHRWLIVTTTAVYRHRHCHNRHCLSPPPLSATASTVYH